MPTRAEKSERTFEGARKLAEANGMTFTNPSDGCFQLRHKAKGWIINLYPRHSGASLRAYHDPKHKGPFLKLPANWTLLDAVAAAVVAEAMPPVDMRALANNLLRNAHFREEEIGGVVDAMGNVSSDAEGGL